MPKHKAASAPTKNAPSKNAPTKNASHLEKEMQKLVDARARSKAVYSKPGRLPITKIHARPSSKHPKFDARLVRDVVMHIQDNMVENFRKINPKLTLKQARKLIPKADSAFVMEHAARIEQIAVMQMPKAARRIALARNIKTSGDQVESVPPRDAGVVVCNTEADLKNPELGLVGAAMAATAYARPRKYDRQEFLNEFKRLSEQKDKMDKAAQKAAAVSQADTERGGESEADAVAGRVAGRVEREEETETVNV